MEDEPDSPHSSHTDEEGTTDDEPQNENNESESSGRTKIRLKAYDLEVEAESEDASFDEMASVLTEEFAQIRRDAMVAEYEEIEERELHGLFIGGDR